LKAATGWDAVPFKDCRGKTPHDIWTEPKNKAIKKHHFISQSWDKSPIILLPNAAIRALPKVIP
jgi:transposase